MPELQKLLSDGAAKMLMSGTSAAAQLEGLLALSTEAIVCVGLELRIMVFNRGAEEIFGYSASEVLGQPLSLLLPESSAVRHDRLVAEALAADEMSREMAARRPVRGRRKDGREFEALVSIGTQRVGKETIATAIIRDVSALRASERLLRDTARDYASLIDESPAGMLVVSAAGRIRKANQAFATMMRLETAAAAEGLAFDERFIDAGDWGRISRALLAHTRYPGTEHRLLAVDGTSELTVLINAVSAETTAEAEARSAPNFHVFVLDLTARRVLEDTVRRTEQLELIGRLAGGVAHDFNNLLLVIRLSAAMLAEERDLSPRGRLDLQEIQQAALRAGELTQQLLAFGRRQLLRPVSLDLADLVTRQEPLLRRLLGEDVILRIERKHSNPRIKADEAQIERVLANLSTNARDAMSCGGLVRILIDAATPTRDDLPISPALSRGEWVRLSFADSGAGMDATARGRIFDPFFSTKEIGRGTGLGLASVYGIVTQSGGCVSVESEVGVGTTFNLWFPLDDGSEPDSSTASAPSRNADGDEQTFALPLTVLLVEDEPSVRLAIERTLESHGVTVLSASDARTAILMTAAHEGPVDAVISDIVLPGLSGPRMVDWIAERHPGMRTLFISGYAPETAEHRGPLRAGSAFLAKPFTPEELLRALSGLLAENR